MGSKCAWERGQFASRSHSSRETFERRMLLSELVKQGDRRVFQDVGA